VTDRKGTGSSLEKAEKSEGPKRVKSDASKSSPREEETEASSSAEAPTSEAAEEEESGGEGVAAGEDREPGGMEYGGVA